MRSTFSGLNTMVRGIIANQISQETVGHNITNATTEGYSRQAVNLVTTKAIEHSGLYGEVLIGSGVDTNSVIRARDVYADRNYWQENSTDNYLKAMQKQYDKIEAVFNDTTNETIQSALQSFYQAWQTLSDSASNSSSRLSVINQGANLADRIKTAAFELRTQINEIYTDISLGIGRMNEMLGQMTELNKNIFSAEATGANANDLRDQRDLLVDKLTEYININVYENEKGMYVLVSNGVSLVNGGNKLTLEMTEPQANKEYGVTDFDVVIAESQVEFLDHEYITKDREIPYSLINGSLRADFEAINECKKYIDDLANMASFLLSDFNEQHQQGSGIDTPRTSGLNFFGDSKTLYEWTTLQRTDGSGNIINYQALVGTQYADTLSAKGYEVKQNPNYGVNDPNYNYVAVRVDGGTVTSAATEIKKIDAINALSVNTQLTNPGGEAFVAASSYGYELNANNQPRVYTSLPSGYTQGTTYTYNEPDATNPNATIQTTLTGYNNNNGDPADKMARVNVVRIDNSTTPPTTTTVSDGYYHLLLNGTGDGANAVMLGTLFNLDMSKTPKYDNTATNPAVNEIKRAIGTVSLNAYYNHAMTNLGNDAETYDSKVEAQEEIMTQITEWRESTAGVNWNQELTNMIMFQQGYMSCARCLTTMDEMLDKLINGTGVVGR